MTDLFKVETCRSVIATCRHKRDAKDMRDGYNKAFVLSFDDEGVHVHRGHQHKRGETGKFRYPYPWSGMVLGP